MVPLWVVPSLRNSFPKNRLNVLCCLNVLKQYCFCLIRLNISLQIMTLKSQHRLAIRYLIFSQSVFHNNKHKYGKTKVWWGRLSRATYICMWVIFKSRRIATKFRMAWSVNLTDIRLQTFYLSKISRNSIQTFQDSVH